MKKKIIDIEETLCICGDSSRQHTKMNKKSWDRLNKQLEGYNEGSWKDREMFWDKFLTEGSIEEWRCNECDCEAFKMDNLKYLEQKYKERTKNG